MNITLSKSNRKGKKYMVNVDGKVIYFGQAGASDYTKHKNDDRKARYIARHRKRENWTKSGIKTAGYWAKNVLWNKKTIKDSIKDIEKRHRIKIN